MSLVGARTHATGGCKEASCLQLTLEWFKKNKNKNNKNPAYVCVCTQEHSEMQRQNDKANGLKCKHLGSLGEANVAILQAIFATLLQHRKLDVISKLNFFKN